MPIMRNYRVAGDMRRHDALWRHYNVLCRDVVITFKKPRNILQLRQVFGAEILKKNIQLLHKIANVFF